MKFKVGDKVLVTQILVLELNSKLDYRYIGRKGTIIKILFGDEISYPINVYFGGIDDTYFNEKELVLYNKTAKILFGGRSETRKTK